MELDAPSVITLIYFRSPIKQPKRIGIPKLSKVVMVMLP